MSRKIGIIALTVIMVVGTIFVFAHFAGNTYVSMQNRHIGVNVNVSGSKVPRNIQAKSVQKQDGWTPPAETQPLTPIVEVTPSGPLPAPMTMRFKLNRQATPDDVLLIATSESMNGTWDYLPATVSADGWYATAEVKHLSFFDVIGASLGKLADTFKHAIINGITSDAFTSAEKPHCDNEDQARQNDYTVMSSSKDTLYWCFGVENKSRVLKIVNRMRYPLEVSTNGLAPMGVKGPRLGQFARIGNADVLYPFDEADYAVSDLNVGGKVYLLTTYSGLAQSIYQLQEGVSVALDFLGIGGGEVQSAKYITTIKAMNNALSQSTCAGTIGSNGTAGETFKDCFDQDKLVKVYGFKAMLLVAVMKLSDLISFFHSEIDSIAAQFTGQADYGVRISRTTTTTQNPPAQNPPAQNPPAPQPPSPPAPKPPTVTPVPQPPPVTVTVPPAPPSTLTEQEGDRGANSFTNPHNASGVGPHLDAMTNVQVSCKVYAPEIQSINPDGYWYRIASAPWNNAYYVAANTFWNGDVPGQKPYTHNTDWNVPNC